jgi:hypothetical protein
MDIWSIRKIHDCKEHQVKVSKNKNSATKWPRSHGANESQLRFQRGAWGLRHCRCQTVQWFGLKRRRWKCVSDGVQYRSLQSEDFGAGRSTRGKRPIDTVWRHQYRCIYNTLLCRCVEWRRKRLRFKWPTHHNRSNISCTDLWEKLT